MNNLDGIFLPLNGFAATLSDDPPGESFDKYGKKDHNPNCDVFPNPNGVDPMPVNFADRTKFFVALFGAKAGKQVADNADLKADFSMYAVKLSKVGALKTFTITTAKSVGKIASGAADAVSVAKVATAVIKALDQLGALPAGSQLPEAVPVVASVPIAAPPKVDGSKLPKVKLRDAEAVGQPVGGTGSSSTYYVIALTPTLRMAARLVPGENKLSVRVEGAVTPAEQKTLLAMGVEKTSDHHWSCHFFLDKVPLERVIGAVVFGSGFDWIDKVENAQQLKAVLHV